MFWVISRIFLLKSSINLSPTIVTAHRAPLCKLCDNPVLPHHILLSVSAFFFPHHLRITKLESVSVQPHSVYTRVWASLHETLLLPSPYPFLLFNAWRNNVRQFHSELSFVYPLVGIATLLDTCSANEWPYSI